MQLNRGEDLCARTTERRLQALLSGKVLGYPEPEEWLPTDTRHE